MPAVQGHSGGFRDSWFSWHRLLSAPSTLSSNDSCSGPAGRASGRWGAGEGAGLPARPGALVARTAGLPERHSARSPPPDAGVLGERARAEFFRKPQTAVDSSCAFLGQGGRIPCLRPAICLPQLCHQELQHRPASNAVSSENGRAGGSVYRQHPEQGTPESREADHWLPGAGDRSDRFRGVWPLFGVGKRSWNQTVVMAALPHGCPKATESCAVRWLRWYVLCCENFHTITKKNPKNEKPVPDHFMMTPS